MRAALTALATLLAAVVAGAQPVVPQNQSPGFLGVAISEPAKVDDATAQQYFGARTAEEFLKAWRLRVEDRGALVLTVLPGHAADRFGIIPGDLIVAVNGAEIANGDRFQRLVGALRPGTEVILTLLRAGREKRITARLGGRPAEYPPAFQGMPEIEVPKAAPPPDAMPPLVTPEEAAKALGADFSPEPAADPDYDAAVKLYEESRVANAEGLLLAGPIALGTSDAAAARAGDEVVKLGVKPIATPMGFAFEILKHKNTGELPLTLDVRGAEGMQDEGRTLSIVNARDADSAASALFFTDEDRVLFWLLDFFPRDSAKNAEEQKSLSPQTRAGASFPFPAIVLTAPVTFHGDGSEHAVECVPGDILVRMQWMQPDRNRREDSLLFIHDGRRTWPDGANWNPRVADLIADGKFRPSEWCEPARLQPRQLLECVVAARALRLTRLSDNAAAFLLAAYPSSKEAAALNAHDRPIQLAAWHAQLRQSAAAGDIRLAVEAAEAILGKDTQGHYGQEAERFMDCVNAAAEVHITRAEKFLDSGDVAGARQETASVARAVPENARLASLLGRCDDLNTLQTGRRALAGGQLRRARLMAEAVLNRDPKGAAVKPAQQLLDDVRNLAKSRTDRAIRLLDAGDADSAREELAPVLQAFPDDPAAIAAWNRSRPPPKKVP
jgi:hypothetical protein